MQKEAGLMGAIKTILFLAFLFVVCASADEVGDRFAIGQAIVSLNHVSQPSAIFADQGDGSAQFEQLRKSTPARAFRIIQLPGTSVSDPADPPTVTISREPLGEATIHLPSQFPDPKRGIVFISADVALAEGACTFEDDGGTTRSKPLLFVMKKEGGDWKIASLRLLAPRASTPE
jgi:hypothetical protein